MTLKNSNRLALEKLLSYEKTFELPVRTIVQLHHVVSCIYKSALSYGPGRIKISVDYSAETVRIMVDPQNELMLDMIRSELLDLVFVPTAWTVDFELKDNDCWLDPVVFFMQAPIVD